MQHSALHHLASSLPKPAQTTMNTVNVSAGCLCQALPATGPSVSAEAHLLATSDSTISAEARLVAASNPIVSAEAHLLARWACLGVALVVAADMRHS